MPKCSSCGKTLGLDGDGFSLSQKTNYTMMCDTCYQKRYGILPPISGLHSTKKEDVNSEERGVVSFD